jgi:hypothetical protein
MATAREVLKHFSVEVCVMVDLDKASLYTLWHMTFMFCSVLYNALRTSRVVSLDQQTDTAQTCLC